MSLSPSSMTFTNSEPAGSNLGDLRRHYELQTIACLHASYASEEKLNLLSYWKPTRAESLIGLFIHRKNQPKIPLLPSDITLPGWINSGSTIMDRQILFDCFNESTNLLSTLDQLLRQTLDQTQFSDLVMSSLGYRRRAIRQAIYEVNSIVGVFLQMAPQGLKMDMNQHPFTLHTISRVVNNPGNSYLDPMDGFFRDIFKSFHKAYFEASHYEVPSSLREASNNHRLTPRLGASREGAWYEERGIIDVLQRFKELAPNADLESTSETIEHLFLDTILLKGHFVDSLMYY